MKDWPVEVQAREPLMMRGWESGHEGDDACVWLCLGGRYLLGVDESEVMHGIVCMLYVVCVG